MKKINNGHRMVYFHIKINNEKLTIPYVYIVIYFYDVYTHIMLYISANQNLRNICSVDCQC